MDIHENTEGEGLWVQCNNEVVRIRTEGCVTVGDLARKIVTNDEYCRLLRLERRTRRLDFFRTPGSPLVPESLPLIAVLGRIGNNEDRPIFAKARLFFDELSKQFKCSKVNNHSPIKNSHRVQFFVYS